MKLLTDFDFLVPNRWKTLRRFFDKSRGFGSSTVILRFILLDILFRRHQCHICFSQSTKLKIKKQTTKKE